MKTIRVNAGLFFALISPYLLFSQNAGGTPGNPQSGTNYPPGPIVVSIRALDQTAAEQGNDTASFQIYRFGDVSTSLMVPYSISGSASNGVDYVQIPDSITIPAGSNSAMITITPMDDNLPEPVETVIITLKQNTDYSFDVGGSGIMANRAYIRIIDNETNALPKIAITQPSNGDIFQLPTNIIIKAEAADEDGFVQKVAFFANGSLLGYFYNTNNTGRAFTFVWQNLSAGDYVLTAKAYDNSGGEKESEPISISIKSQVPERDVVTIEVVDGEAQEIPQVPTGIEMPQRINIGIVRLHRTGPTNFPLYVNYSLTGTASNGVDYVQLSGVATIPDGSRTAHLEIIPIYDNLIEGTETVIVRVEPPICIAIYPPPPDCYIVGEPAEALVKILDSQSTTNIPPEVAITSPQDGAIFTAPANIILNAKALDQDGYVNTVEFWANDIKLCTITNIPESARPVSPFFFVWTNVPSGKYVLKAVATDNEGDCGVSSPVRIQVFEPTNQMPIVTIVATDSEASELPPIVYAFNSGIFTVRRTGPIDSPLTVYYTISGTASNGIDYKELSGTVQIPAGKAFADIEVIPFDENVAEGIETVIATLIVPQIIITIYPPPPPPYIVGEPNQATVYIYGNETYPTNIPPLVRITKPRNGMTFTAPADIGICAEAFDRDGKIATVEIYEGTNKLGDALSPTNISSVLYPYYFMWKNVGAGDYVLTAIATDDCGQSTKSEPVRIKVIEPITNTIPVVNIKTIDGLACEGPFTPIVIYTNFNSAGFGSPQIITNRVPNINTATFLVKREGPTNSELTVHYAISGTASNSVDYLALPGIVVIPEGSRSATITIVPIEDKIPEGPETVVLILVPSVSTTTNEPSLDGNIDKPPYLIGPYEKASAVIVDNDLPITPIRLPDGQFHFYKPAPTNMVYILEVSSDLIHWTPVITNTATEGFINYVDTDSPDYKRRFYRVLPVQQ